MSSTFAPIDAATIAGLNSGSEQALEKIFRDHYTWIMEAALVRLKGEDAAAPKLMVATVREFWEERDGFHSSAEVEAFFNEELRHRARAVRARMAAVHRFEKAEGVHKTAAHAAPTIDGIWAEIVAELHKPQVDAATVAKRRRIKEFWASVMPENRAMAGLFLAVGGVELKTDSQGERKFMISVAKILKSREKFLERKMIQRIER